MSHYLQVCAGPYQLLLDADGIHEILYLDGGDGAESAGRRDWRGQALIAVNGRTLLGMKDDVLPRERAGVVYSSDADATPLMLEFDYVARLHHLNEMGLQPLPLVPKRVMRLFDGVFLDNEAEVQIYHLRRPLDAEVFMEQADEVDLFPSFTELGLTEVDAFIPNEVNEPVLSEIDEPALSGIEGSVLSGVEGEQSAPAALQSVEPSVAEPVAKKRRSRGKRKG